MFARSPRVLAVTPAHRSPATRNRGDAGQVRAQDAAAPQHRDGARRARSLAGHPGGGRGGPRRRPARDALPGRGARTPGAAGAAGAGKARRAEASSAGTFGDRLRRPHGEESPRRRFNFRGRGDAARAAAWSPWQRRPRGLWGALGARRGTGVQSAEGLAPSGLGRQEGTPGGCSVSLRTQCRGAGVERAGPRGPPVSPQTVALVVASLNRSRGGVGPAPRRSPRTAPRPPFPAW